MTEMTGIEMYRDGGTIEFEIASHEIAGLYRLQTPLKGTPQPLFRDGQRLPFGSPDEVAVLDVLREWLSSAITADIAPRLDELDQLRLWQNLPERLIRVVPIYHIRSVAQQLEERIPPPDRARQGVA